MRYVIGLMLVLLCAPEASAQNASRPPGLEPYTPTRLEWLTLELRTGLRREFAFDNKFALDFIHRAPDTIVIFVRYREDVHRATLNAYVEQAKEIAASAARRYGWDWLKVVEDVQQTRRGR